MKKTSVDILHELEKENKYLFHGSENNNVDKFLPNQAFNYRNGIQEKDGEPAVFATNRIDYAILMALVNMKNCPKGYSAGAKMVNSILKLKVSKFSYKQLDENSVGYVYVFDKSNFEQREQSLIEFVSFVPVSPINMITIKKDDLPGCINFFD